MPVVTPTLIKVSNYINGRWQNAATTEWLEPVVDESS